MPARFPNAALMSLIAAAALVAGAEPAATRSASVGGPSDGRLEAGFRLPLSGAFHRFYGPVEARGTQYATLEMAALLVRAARTVEAEAPGPKLALGDCSAREGGDLARHASHTSGRDVDLLFYVRDGRGAPVTARTFHAFGGDGRCLDEGCRLRLDDRRTWWLVRTLLASQEPAVAWIFVARPIAERLIAWAERHGEHPQLLARARRVLHQPSDSAPHADHLHVRTFCTAGDIEAGCRDDGPRWPWVGDDGRARPIGP